MTTDSGATSEGVHELVRQRDQLRVWIEKLDQVGSGTATRVQARVRADYEERLRRVTEELSAHAEEVQRTLEQTREALAAAEDRRGQALDALEETRLRYDIGELDDAAWEQARQPLEAATAEAEAEVANTAAEVERLSTLAGEIAPAAGGEEGGGDQAAAPGEHPAEAASPGAEEAGGDEEPAFWSPDAPVEAAGAYDAGTSELEELPLQHFADDEPLAEPEPAPAAGAAPPEPLPAEPEGPVSGADLAAWISEVEAESAGETAAPAEPAAAAEDWDPFANEFGGSPASPATQPGDARQQGPWSGGAHGESTEEHPGTPSGDDLEFLENLDAHGAAAPAPANDLAEDDLAFLEELDRAISGGAQRPHAADAPAPADEELSVNGYTGGSGGGNFAPPPSEAVSEQRKRGEALLCKECGAINEPQAWYCEICGSEL